MTQQDMARALKKETGRGLSQSYLSQIESGARPHLTNASRMLLARFFKVHPGYLVDDPEGYHTELTSDLRATEDRLDLWLINGAEQFARDPELSHALLASGQASGHAQMPGAAGRNSGNAGTGGTPGRGTEAGPGSGCARAARQQGVGGSELMTVGDLLSRVLSGGSDAERLVVYGRKPASAARPCCTCRMAATLHTPHLARPQERARQPRRRGDAVLQLRHRTGVSDLVWRLGYLLTRYSTLVVSLIMLIAVIVGLVGATIIFWFVAKLLMKHDRELDPADYERVGVLGRIISPIREGGTGRNYLFARRHAANLRGPQ